MEFRFETKICFVKTLFTLAHSYSSTYFFQLTATPDLLLKHSLVHIYKASIIFVISMLLRNAFNTPHIFVNVTVIPVHTYYFIFYFKFYYPIVDIIVNHIYALFLRSRKPIQNVVTKIEKNP